MREAQGRYSVRRSCPWLPLALLSLLAACGRPPSAIAEGPVIQHDAGFELVVPEGWQYTESRTGLSLVRMTPYGGGFPTVHVRRIDPSEAAALEISGSSRRIAGSSVVYRYRSWSNSRGRGYRLDTVLDSGRGILVAEASIWDSSPSLNRRLFEEQFWPIINSIVDRGP